MLGSLARWLRLFGFDCEYPAPGIEDQVLADRARAEGRWLLTRDRELAAVGPRSMLIRETDLDDQLVEVFSRLACLPAATLEVARCAECNGELEEVAPRDVSDSAPPHILQTASRFSRCSGCGRVYWPGSHGERIVRRMAAVVERARDVSSNG